MEFFTNGNQSQPLSSRMENDIRTILNSQKYKSLNEPYDFKDNKSKFRSDHTILTRKLISFCDLLKSLVNDRPVWEKYEMSECPFYPLRLRYRIVGNVLKAIFFIHERNKRLFLATFRKEYVKTFTFPASGNRVKIVVLKHIKNEQQGINDRRPPLQDLSIIRPSGSEIRNNVVSIENGGTADVLGNIPADVPLQQAVAADNQMLAVEVPEIPLEVQRTVEHLPVPTTEVLCDLPVRNEEQLAMLNDIIHLEEQTKRWAAAHRIEVAGDSEPSEADRTRSVRRSIAASLEIHDEEYNERQRIAAFLRESGLGVEGHEHITTDIELQRILETEFTQGFALPQAVVQRTRPVTALSQESDNTPRTFEVHADVHEIPAGLRTPRPALPTAVAERTAIQETPSAVDQVQVLVSEGISTVIQVQTDVHEIPTRLLESQYVPPTVESEKAVQEMQSILDQAQTTTVPDFETHRVEELPTLHGKPNTHLPLAQTDTVRPMDGISGITRMDEGQQIMQKDVPILSASYTRQTPALEERAVETVASMRTPTRERVTEEITTRPTIADLLIQGGAAEPQLLPEVMKAMEQPGPIFEMSQLDIPINQEQKASAAIPPRRIGDILKDALPIKKPAAKRKKYVFYSNVVMTRKLKKNIKPEMYVSHSERLKNAAEFLRRPLHRVIPFDQYESDEENLDFIRRFDVPVDELRDCGNIMSNLLCQLFEKSDDIMYDEENECENRIARLRASIRLPRTTLQRSRFSFRTGEPPEKSLPPMDNDGRQFLQVPVAAEAPSISTRFPTSLPNVEDLALQVPVTEQLSVVPKSPVPQPMIQAPSVEPRAVTTEQEKVIEWEEVIPHKRSRKALDQNIIDVVQRPTESTFQQREQTFMPQVDPVAQLLAESGLQGEQISSIPQMGPTMGIAVPIEVVEQQIEEVVIPRRKRVSSKEVLDKLTILWNEKSGEPVLFSELCGVNNKDRFTIASTFSVLLSLHGMKMLNLSQEPEDSWSRDSVLIYRR